MFGIVEYGAAYGHRFCCRICCCGCCWLLWCVAFVYGSRLRPGDLAAAMCVRVLMRLGHRVCV